MTAPMREAPWKEGIEKKGFPELADSIEGDVVIAGGGLTGIVLAYLLAKEGKKPIVLEEGVLGNGATERTTAMLTESIDTDYADVVRAFGKVSATGIVRSHEDAIKTVADIVRDEKIDCDFTLASNVIYINKESEFASLKAEYEAGRELGVPMALVEDGSALGFPNAGAVEIRDQAMFHPLKFLYALADAAVASGARIFENTKADSLESRDGGVVASANGHEVRAAWGVSATYEPFHQPLSLFFKKGMYITYVLEAFVKNRKLKVGMYEDTELPYHYMRIEEEGEGYRVIVGGEDHRADIPIDDMRSYNALTKYLGSLVPEENFEVRRMWGGHILEPLDGIPLIGPIHDDHILYASAFSGNGMTYAVIAAKLLADYVSHRTNPLHEVYSAKRLPGLMSLITKGRDYSEEMIGGALKNVLTEPKKPNEKLQ